MQEVDLEEESKYPDPTDLEDFNRIVRDLLDYMSSNPGVRRIEEMSPDYKLQWMHCFECVDYLLWLFCMSQTNNQDLANAAVTNARIAFIQKLRAHNSRESLWRWAVENCTTLLVPFNCWLFLRAREAVHSLEKEFDSCMIPQAKYPIAAPKDISEALALFPKSASMQCPLKSYRVRVRSLAYTLAAKARRQLSAANCRDVCDLILLTECGFGKMEMGVVLGINKNVPRKQLKKCEQQWNRQSPLDQNRTK